MHSLSKFIILLFTILLFSSCEEDDSKPTSVPYTGPGRILIANLVDNGDFENSQNNRPEDWNLNSNFISLSNVKSQSGNNAMKIEGNQYFATEVDFSQQIAESKFEYGKKYIFSAWIYAEYLNATSEFGLSLGNNRERAKLRVDTTQSGWNKLSYEFIAEGEGSYTIRFQPYNFSGTNKTDYRYLVWVDNLTLVKKN